MKIEFRRALKENDKDKIEAVKQSTDGKISRSRKTRSNSGKFSE